MKAGKRFITLLLAMVLVFSLVAACANNNTGNSGNVGAENTGNNEAFEQNEEAADQEAAETSKVEAIRNGTYKFETPVTITTVKATDNTMKFKNGETMEDNVHTRWARDELGINIEHLWQVPGDQFATKIRLMLTSGEDLPDVFTTQDMTLLDEMIQSGLYRDITADYEKYASDKIKDIYGSDPLLWSQVTYDGKKMALPHFAHAGNDNGVMWIRQDWLDELGLQAPETMEQLEAMLQAFLEKKPGGVDNVIPLGVSLGAGGSNPNPFSNWLGESTWVFGPYGTVPYQWIEDENGQLVHGSTKPEMKEGLAKLRDWYDNGYISKEAGLHDENKLAELIGQGRVGMVVAPYWLTNWPIPDLKKNVTGATMKPYPLPSADGVTAARDTTFLRGGVLIKEDFEHVDALFLYLNRIFERIDPAPGSEFEHGWAEGYDYAIKEDGTVSRSEEDIEGGKVSIAKYVIIEPKNPFSNLRTMANASRGHQRTADEKRVALSDPDLLKAAEIVDDGWNEGIYVPNLFTGANTPAMQSKGGILTKLEGETFVGIIYGSKPLDAFDEFVEEWKELGGEEMTKEANEWYELRK